MAKVTVGLKYASDLIIQVGNTEVLLNGFSRNLIESEHAHGITENVDESFFNEWMKINKDHSLVQGGFIFALESKKETEAKAKDQKKKKGGTEPLEQNSEGVETREG